MQEAEKERLQQQLKDALVAIKKLKSGLISEKNKKHEPIAVIGMAMRLPGHVYNAKDYWKLLFDGVDAISDIPESRFDAKSLYDPNPDTLGKMVVKQGGFLDQIDQFDGSFFDLSYAEIESMDPQQRLLLEVTYEALENAGIPAQSIVGSNTGVYVGVTNNDYQKRHFRSGDYTLINPYSYTGSAVSSNAGRISYLMGLQGPSLALDTACSSSLVATHLATQSLRNGESDLAIAGAANVIIDPEFTIYFSSLNSLSKDSRCKSFSNEANGFIRSEGAGILILKRLSDAQRDGDNILAVVKGTAVNQDGRSNGFTAPNVKAQERLIKKALADGKLKPEQIAFIEAHGTGTKIGDPIEMEAIAETFAASKTKEHPLYVGSVKTNIGHSEGVAGVAGMMKAVLSIQNKTIPQNIHFKTPNELIDWKNLPIEVPVKNTAWDTDAQYIGVSGFGVTGTNAHVILGAAPKTEEKIFTQELRKDVFVLPLSAKTIESLQALASAYSEFISESKEDLEDICAMAALKRSALEVRKVFVARDKEQLIEQLNDFSELSVEESKNYDADDTVKVVFVCPGQGAQWIGMAQQLYESEPVFKKSLDECAQAFSKVVSWDLIEELKGNRFDEIDIIQPIIVAIEIALGQLWKSKGIHPDIVVGHSLGEVAAAYLAEMISIDDAALIICTRSSLMKQNSGKGAMAVTDLTLEEAHQKISGQESYLSVAVQNSPNSTVIAGDPTRLQELLNQLDGEGRFCRMIKVDVASHSPQMDNLLDPLKDALKNIQTQNSNIVFYSTALREKVKGKDLNADYWVKNLRNPVQFGAVIQDIAQKDEVVFIELTPHPVLSNAVQENLESIKKRNTTVPTLWREKDELVSFYSAFGQYFESGLEVDWTKIYLEVQKFVLLPNYQWQKERFWFDEKPNLSQSPTTITAEVPVQTAEIKEEPKAKEVIFETIWKEVDIVSTQLPESVVIVRDEDGMAEKLVTLLSAQNVHTQIISSNELPTIAPDLVIHLASTKATASLQDAIFSFQDLIQHFNQVGKSPMIVAVTKHGQVIGQEDQKVHIPSTALWGMMRTLRNEFPELNPTTIDIQELTSAQDILKIISQKTTYKEFAFRNSSVYTPALKAVTNIKSEVQEFSDNMTYLVTGGTSGLGLVFAQWLASKGVKNLALVSRSGMKPETESVVERLRSEGVKVEVFQSDVTLPDSLAKLVMEVETILPTIRGVVHAAGLLDDGAFLNLTHDQFNKVLAPKINGAWNLHKYFSARNLESFVLFSSGASVLGTAAQANYTAANMALDQLAHYRKSLGLSALSINFGNIGEVGLAAADTKRGERLQDQGMGVINPEQLKTYLDQLFDLPGAQYMLMDIDFNIWAQNNSGIQGNAFYDLVLKPTPTVTKETPQEDKGFTSKSGAIRHYKTIVKNLVSSITKIPTSKLKEDATFKSLGIDSLMAVQLKNKLQTESGLDLAVSSIWTYPTVEKYTEYLVEELKIEDQIASAESAEEEPSTGYANRPAAIRHIKSVIKNLLSAITKIPVSKIKEDATFKSFGVDSLMAVQFKNRLQTEFELNIAVSSIWAHSTVEKYAEFLADELNIQDAAPETSKIEQVEAPKVDEISTIDQIQNEVDQMSLDDLLKALDD